MNFTICIPTLNARPQWADLTAALRAQTVQPREVLVADSESDDGTAELAASDPLPLPYVVKPVNEGSSVGVEILRAGDNRREEIARRWHYGPLVLAEEFIPGRELTVGVLGDRALGVTEIVASHAFYDYESKYQEGGSRHILPAPIPPATAGASRTDFRYDDATSPGRLVILETNAQPGLTPTSLLPEQAAHCGIDFSALCVWMVEQARCRA